jgi:hypothetical protein
MSQDPDAFARYVASVTEDMKRGPRVDVIDAGVTILGGLLKVAIVVIAVKFLFFT